MAIPASEHAARRLALGAIVAGLLVLCVISLPRHRPVSATPLRWSAIAPPPSSQMHAWRWIVIHHSAADTGDAAGIDAQHEKVNGWDGIGYHFLIGNGRPMPLGRIEGTFRWKLQREGAHAKIAEYN